VPSASALSPWRAIQIVNEGRKRVPVAGSSIVEPAPIPTRTAVMPEEGL
jgi:hypothetical protein